MSPPDDHDAAVAGQSTPDDAPGEDGAPLIVLEFAVAAESFVLDDVLGLHPNVVVEYERFVPTNHSPLPYVWATDAASRGFGEDVAAASTVERVRTVATFEEGSLYHVEWADDDGELLHWIAETTEDVALLQAEGRDDEWRLKLRFASRARFDAFRAFYEERTIDVDVVRLYDETIPKMGQYNVSRKQREALVVALEMGFFEIPRTATLADVAASLGISKRAASERLRRGHTNLISNSLTIGRPSAVGIGGGE